MTFDYKNYSLDNLKNWLHDCMSAGEATPEEVYNTILEVVLDEKLYYDEGAAKTERLLQLLQGKLPKESISFDNKPYYDTMAGVKFYDYSSSSQSDTITFTKTN